MLANAQIKNAEIEKEYEKKYCGFTIGSAITACSIAFFSLVGNRQPILAGAACGFLSLLLPCVHCCGYASPDTFMIGISSQVIGTKIFEYSSGFDVSTCAFLAAAILWFSNVMVLDNKVRAARQAVQDQNLQQPAVRR